MRSILPEASLRFFKSSLSYYYKSSNVLILDWIVRNLAESLKTIKTLVQKSKWATNAYVSGRKIMESASKTLKHLTLELGGNDAAVVLPDADVTNVAQTLFWASFTNSGQICVATKRIYVHEDIYDEFVKTFVAMVGTVKVGNGLDEDTVFGPISNKPQYDRVVDLIQDSIDNRYEILAGGLPSEAKGFFIPLTVIGNPPKDARVVKEEQFGPVIPIVKFKDVEEAIEEVNSVEFGLGGTIWAGNTEEGTG
jgi:acyl-CoA reductase-like NAD-dependent aldehyde dehydrogenase